MKKKINVTRKIQLFIDSKDSAFIKQTYETLYRWRHICFRSSNYLVTHHFVQDRIADLFYLTEDMRIKLTNVNKDPNGILVTSQANTTYRLLTKHFKGSIPTAIINALNHSILNNFFANVEGYRTGEKSLPNYKRNTLIPFNGENLRRLTPIADGKEFSFKLFSVPFRTYMGRDLNDKRSLLRRMHAREIKFCGSSLALDKGKIYLLACFELDQERHQLNEEIIAEASLSIDYPIVVKIGKVAHTIGTKEEFLHRRLAIQAARRRAQGAVKYVHGGHGKKRKQKSLDAYSHAEARYVKHRLHVYSRELIDFCIKHQAATLILIDQQKKEESTRDDRFLFHNWSVAGLRDKIKFKAEKAGITLIVE
jgi:hypothetical protein